MADSSLPAEARPLWIEGVFTSEYERDTLPLLFSSDRIFDEYYDALIQKNQHVSVALEQIRMRNAQARQQRADGFWADCIESLSHCVHLRRCVFEENDFQYSAAQKHCIFSTLNIATYFLKESKSQDTMMMRAFELFKRAEAAVGAIRHKEDRLFMKAAVDNNFATYFAKRKKYKAAAQRSQIGLRAWSALGIRKYELYFAVLRGSGEVWSNRFDEALKFLNEAMKLAPSTEEEEGGGAKQAKQQDGDDDQDGENLAPVRFSIQVLGCGLGVVEASHIALNHNIAVSLIGLRRYQEAAEWCTKAMDLASSHSAVLKASHPIVQTIAKAQQFCEKLAFSTKFTQYRMKQGEHVASTKRKRHMEEVVSNQQSQQRQRGTTPRGQSSQSNRPRIHGGANPDADAETERKNTEAVRKAEKHPQTRLTAAIYFPRYTKPSTAEALRTYVTGFSERQLIEEYGFEGAKKKKQAPRPPPKTADGQRPAKKKDKEKRAESAEPTSARSVQSSHHSSRHSSRQSSRKSSSSPRAHSDSRSRSRSPTSSRSSSGGKSPRSNASSYKSNNSPTKNEDTDTKNPDAESREEEAVRKKEEDEAAAKKQEEEDAAKEKEEEDAAAKKKEDEAAPQKTDDASPNKSGYGDDEFEASDDDTSPKKGEKTKDNDPAMEEEAKKQDEEEARAASQKREEDEAAAKKQQDSDGSSQKSNTSPTKDEDTDRKNPDEENSREDEEAVRKKEEDEAAAKKQEEEDTAKEKEEEDAAAAKKAEEDAAAAKKVEEDAAAAKKAEEDAAAAKKAEEDAAAAKKAEEDAAAAKKAEEDAAAAKKQEEEDATKEKEEEDAAAQKKEDEAAPPKTDDASPNKSGYGDDEFEASDDDASPKKGEETKDNDPAMEEEAKKQDAPPEEETEPKDAPSPSKSEGGDANDTYGSDFETDSPQKVQAAKVDDQKKDGNESYGEDSDFEH